MASSPDYLAYVLEQLAQLPILSSRRMFGGYGLYCDGRFFALISRDVLYLRVNDANRADYQSRGMAQFRPRSRGREVSMNYFELPADVLEDAEECAAWARRSVAAATPAPAQPKPKLKPKPTRRQRAQPVRSSSR